MKKSFAAPHEKRDTELGGRGARRIGVAARRVRPGAVAASSLIVEALPPSLESRLGGGAVGRPCIEYELYCPFDESGLNPHVDVVQRDSVEWALKLRLVRPEARRRLDDTRIAWLGARMFPSAPKAVLQLVADWTTLFCLLDDHVELEEPVLLALSEYLCRLLSGFRDRGTMPDDPIGSGLLDLRRRMSHLADPGWVERFSQHLEDLFAGYLWEATNRWSQLQPRYSAYRTMRAITIGLRPQHLLGELGRGVTLSERTRAHPLVETLELRSSLAVAWANDIFTHGKELADGDVHNLVLVLMQTKSLTLAQALNRASVIHDQEVRGFLSARAQLPDFGPETNAVQAYAAMLGRMIRGHLDWARETGRYSGPTVAPGHRRESS